ncbi:ATP-binding cassette domain-containing protein [Candidatus Pandoraea novymonadis]|uniref:ATP-binding protein Uup n=1 Tax=Candidatus Pandoraea novymonadis TaxID=1808959 RepID=A0ABX5FG37_9BURK|nr:ATP-binding cassette domain-containing protein [Candidatus Pandoraea novymonadis]PSB91982.1 ABC transporter ATP-binding protein uup [Candidatus Pandoraea novymonadis]
MSLYSITGAKLAFGHVALLDSADFSLEEGERVGLIGRNGAGKSSLLKVAADLIELDEGLVARQSSLNTVYVPQEFTFDPHLSVFDAVELGLGSLQAMMSEYNSILRLLKEVDDEVQHDALLLRLHALQTSLDATDSWHLKTRVETTIDQLGLDANALVSTLSGGMQKRVSLGQALVAQPDILLLDEPTNHLDFQTIRWLEDLLIGFRGTILFVTHDRSFLNHVATRIVELDRGRLLTYSGNFTQYQVRKAQQLEVERIENEKFDKFLAKEEIWIRKGVEARRTRSIARSERLEDMRLCRSDRREIEGNVRMDVSQAEKSGKLVAELKNITKTFGTRTVVNDVTLTVMRGKKIGLIGPNGAGKTTLLKLILGELSPDHGQIRIGTHLQVAYFDQSRIQLDPEKSLIDTISPGSDWIEINGEKKHVISYLGHFLFSVERARSPVRSLSGGERNRLLLARLFSRPTNVLVLDEPTNDLDIPTLELLEELLQEYGGTVFLVSHDRTFLDNVVTSVVVAEDDGQWKEYIGGFSDWQVQMERGQMLSASKRISSSKESLEKKITTTEGRMKNRPVKLSYKEQRELDALPQMITSLETEQTLIYRKLEDGILYAKDPHYAVTLSERFEVIEQELLEALERWEMLEKKQRTELY